MKLNSKSLAYLIIVILMTLTLGLFFVYKNSLESSFAKKETELNEKVKLLDNQLGINLYYSNQNIGLQLNSNIVFIDSHLNKTPITSVVDGKNMLIYRFADTYCSSCVNSGFESLGKNTANIPQENIIVLGSFYNTSDISKYEIRNNKLIQIFGTKHSIGLQIEELGMPYFMVVNKDLEVLSCFVHEKKFPNFTDDYLSGIKHLISE